MIRTLTGTSHQGLNAVRWDMRDTGGSLQPPGEYLVTVDIDGLGHLESPDDERHQVGAHGHRLGEAHRHLAVVLRGALDLGTVADGQQVRLDRLLGDHQDRLDGAGGFGFAHVFHFPAELIEDRGHLGRAVDELVHVDLQVAQLNAVLLEGVAGIVEVLRRCPRQAMPSVVGFVVACGVCGVRLRPQFVFVSDARPHADLEVILMLCHAFLSAVA